MKLLTESEFRKTFAKPMQRIASAAKPPVAFWSYFDAIPTGDFAGYDCSAGSVSHAWNDANNLFQHILIDTANKNVFMVIVLDLRGASVVGHHLLDVNQEYELGST